MKRMIKSRRFLDYNESTVTYHGYHTTIHNVGDAIKHIRFEDNGDVLVTVSREATIESAADGTVAFIA